MFLSYSHSYVYPNVSTLENPSVGFPNPFTNFSEARRVFVLMAWPFLFNEGRQGVTEKTNTGSGKSASSLESIMRCLLTETRHLPIKGQH